MSTLASPLQGHEASEDRSVPQNRVGIGVYLQGTTVADLLPSSPASAGGLVKGDKIFKVDGEPVDTKSVTEALCGSHGSVAVLEVRRSRGQSLSPEKSAGPLDALQTLWDDSTASYENVVLRIPRSPLSPTMGDQPGQAPVNDKISTSLALPETQQAATERSASPESKTNEKDTFSLSDRNVSTTESPSALGMFPSTSSPSGDLATRIGVLEQTRQHVEDLQNQLHQLEEVARKYSKSSVLGIALDKGTAKVVNVVSRSPASRPLQGSPVEKGDELLTVNGIPYVPGSSSKLKRSSVSSTVEDGGSAAEAGGNISARADTEGRLTLQLKRARGGVEEVICHLHKTLLETAADDIFAALEDSRRAGANALFVSKIQKAAGSAIDAASLTDERARLALAESIGRARSLLACLEAQALADEESQTRSGLCNQERANELAAVHRLYENALHSLQLFFQTHTRLALKRRLVASLFLHLHRGWRERRRASDAISATREKRGVLAGVLGSWARGVELDKARSASAAQRVAAGVRRSALQATFEAFLLLMDLKAVAEQRCASLELRSQRKTLEKTVKAMISWHARCKAAVSAAACRGKQHASSLARRMLGHWDRRARAEIRCSRAMSEMRSRRRSRASVQVFARWRMVARERRGRWTKIQAQRAVGAVQVQRQKLLAWMCWMGSDTRSAMSIVRLRLRVWQLQRALVLWTQGLHVKRWHDAHLARMFERRLRRGLLRCWTAWRQLSLVVLEIEACIRRKEAAGKFQLQRRFLMEWSGMWQNRVNTEASCRRRGDRRLRQRSLMAWCRGCDVRGHARRRVDKINAAWTRSTLFRFMRAWSAFLCASSYLAARSEEMRRSTQRAIVVQAKRARFYHWREVTRLSCRYAAWADRKYMHLARIRKSRSLRAWISAVFYSEEVLNLIIARELIRNVDITRQILSEWVSSHRSLLMAARHCAVRQAQTHLRGILRDWQRSVMDEKNERQARASKSFSVQFHCFRKIMSHLLRGKRAAAALCSLRRRIGARLTARCFACWQHIVRHFIVAAQGGEASCRKQRRITCHRSLQNWRVAVNAQSSALRVCLREHSRLQAGRRSACFFAWAHMSEARAEQYASIRVYQNRTFMHKTWKRWFGLCTEHREDRHARLSREYVVRCHAIRAWKAYRRMCSDVVRKISDDLVLLEQIAIRAMYLGWHCLVHRTAERRMTILARVRKRQISRRLLLWRRRALASSNRRHRISQYITRASVLRSAQTLRAVMHEWERVSLIVETPRLSLCAKAAGISQSAALRRLYAAFAGWHSESGESLGDRRFSAASARARLLRVMEYWQATAVGGGNVKRAATLRALRAAGRGLREMWVIWRGACATKEHERCLMVSLGLARIKRVQLMSIVRGWRALCEVRRNASALGHRVFSGTRARAWARWRLHVQILAEVELEIEMWWEAASVRLMPLTYHKGFRDSVFFVWKHIEDHAVLEEEDGPGGDGRGKPTGVKQGRHLAIRSRSAWYRLSRLLACADMHDRFEAALDAWRRETALAHTKLLRIDQHLRRKMSIVLACLLRRVAFRRKIRALSMRAKRQCWGVLKRVHVFGRRLRLVESLACGQMLARKAQVYLRMLFFGAWRLQQTAARRAARHVQRTWVRAREVALHECFAGLRAVRTLAAAERLASQNHHRSLQCRIMRTWAQITWVLLRSSDVPLLAHHKTLPPMRGEGEASAAAAQDYTDSLPEGRCGEPVASGTHGLLLRLDQLDPFQARPSQQLVNFLVGRVRSLAMVLAMREWAATASDSARVRRFQCSAIIRAKTSDSLRALQLALREWHHIATRQAHVRFLSRTVSDILRAGDRNVASILRGGRTRSAERTSPGDLPRSHSPRRVSPQGSYPTSSPSKQNQLSDDDICKALQGSAANGAGRTEHVRPASRDRGERAVGLHPSTLQPISTLCSSPNYVTPQRQAVPTRSSGFERVPFATAAMHADPDRPWTCSPASRQTRLPRGLPHEGAPSMQTEARDLRLYAAARYAYSTNESTLRPSSVTSSPAVPSHSAFGASALTDEFKHFNINHQVSPFAMRNIAATTPPNAPPWQERERALYSQYLADLSPRAGGDRRQGGSCIESHNPWDNSSREERATRAVIAENSFTTQQVWIPLVVLEGRRRGRERERRRGRGARRSLMGFFAPGL